jgi:hypothetical protein
MFDVAAWIGALLFGAAFALWLYWPSLRSAETALTSL